MHLVKHLADHSAVLAPVPGAGGAGWAPEVREVKAEALEAKIER